ncbi:uncharacterized protein LOC129588879 [Paramacrobiotus metropolitanus]|uniref:uncharacterized protein LOC129588879 n=1 Tax=Paramacrobiotus metropolitanus TaxID=2943436 RepID=UPI0024465D6F|nr:uncharacterized protein LOC129588879 [Paramacrobiotus metropolitanus]
MFSTASKYGWKEILCCIVLAASCFLLGYRISRIISPVDPKNCDILSNNRDCTLEFIGYESSAFEFLWLNHILEWQGDPCAQFPAQRRQADAWVTYTARAQYRRPVKPAPKGIFSAFRYRDICDEHEVRVPIEPLAMVTRHPYTCLPDPVSTASYHERYAADKEYLLTAWNAPETAAGKAYYFDLGASTYDTGPGGASQKWIVDQYKLRGVDFHRIFAWEAKPYDPETIFQSIPAELHHTYHWYNFPASANPDSHRNPWNTLQRVVSAEDFVVVKMDIDTPEIENRLVRQLLADPQLQVLIDDFYFEHHVNATPMSAFWGPIKDLYLKDTYEIFLALRQAGIRAHSWV